MDSAAAVLETLAGLAMRSLGLLALAGIGIVLGRVKTPAARHAVWTVTAAGMLLLAALAPVTPPLPLRVLHASPVVALAPVADTVTAVAPGAAMLQRNTPAPVRSTIGWPQVALSVYLAGAAIFLLRLVFGYLFTARLVRASRPVEDDLFESDWISVPMTVGCLRPRVLLPAAWRTWDRAKFTAVLAHERTHVQRRDWAIALLAGVNRCVFWFHPLAWWLERELASLAEQACDDAALLQLSGREHYAQALLDMAAAVRRGEGRLIWEAMAMAKASEVRMRIERILDETRRIPRGVTRHAWAALALGSLPLIYLASAVQLVPALAQEQTAVVAAPAQPPDFAKMEQFVGAHPDDLAARHNLVREYYLAGVKQPRLQHIFWMIRNHPESELTALDSSGVAPRATALNDEQDYQTAAGLWRQQVAAFGGNAQVQANAARFFSQPGADWDEAERLLMAARSLDSHNNVYTQQLARLYGTAVLNASANPGFAAKSRSELEASNDGQLLSLVANELTALGRDGSTRPDTASLVGLGNRLLERARQFGALTMPRGTVRVGPTPPPVDVARIEEQARLPFVTTPPPLVRKVAPEYPTMASAAKMQGDVNLIVTIGTDGRVTDVGGVQGPPLLTRSAADAVRQWVFAPVLRNGNPIVARTRVTVPFRIEGEAALPAAPAAQATEPQPTMPSRIRVGGNVQRVKLLSAVDAVYPQAARDAGIEGTVLLQVVIDKEGKVESTQVLDGHPLLAAEAQQAVMQWVYSPTLLNGIPVEVATTVSVPFPAPGK